MKMLLHGILLSVLVLTSSHSFCHSWVRVAAGVGNECTHSYKASLLKRFDRVWRNGRDWVLGFNHWLSDSSKGSVDGMQGAAWRRFAVKILDGWAALAVR